MSSLFVKREIENTLRGWGCSFIIRSRIFQLFIERKKRAVWYNLSSFLIVWEIVVLLYNSLKRKLFKGQSNKGINLSCLNFFLACVW